MGVHRIRLLLLRQLRSTRQLERVDGSRRALRLVVVLASVTLLVGACGSPARHNERAEGPWAGHTITIGAVFSTTGPGSAYGVSQRLGASLAVRQIDATGGIRGAHLRIIYENDASLPSLSAEVTRHLIVQDHVLALLGPTLSDAASGAHPVADELKTVMLAVSNTGLGIVGDCAYPCRWIFRDSLGEQAAIPANIRAYAREAHPATASVVYPAGDAFGLSEAQIAEESMAPEGIKLLSVVECPSATAPVAGCVAQATSGNPAFLMVTGSSSAFLARVMVRARADGYLGEFLGGNTFNSTVTAKLAGPAGQGAQSAAAWYLGNAFPANESFVASYETAYGRNPDEFAAQAYTGVELLAKAMEAAPLDFTNLARDRQAVFDSLEAVRMETPLGPFSFTPSHDVEQPIWIVQMDGTGGFRLVTSELDQTNA
jgi:branched-chain amino acid transport system substrate-binding protein